MLGCGYGPGSHGGAAAPQRTRSSSRSTAATSSLAVDEPRGRHRRRTTAPCPPRVPERHLVGDAPAIDRGRRRSAGVTPGRSPTSVTVTGLTMSDPIATVKVARVPSDPSPAPVPHPSGRSLDARQLGRGRDRLRHQLHGPAGAAVRVPHVAPRGDEQRDPRQHGQEQHEHRADDRAATRRTLHRWIPMGLRAGASPRNVSSSSAAVRLQVLRGAATGWRRPASRRTPPTAPRA